MQQLKPLALFCFRFLFVDRLSIFFPIVESPFAQTYCKRQALFGAQRHEDTFKNKSRLFIQRSFLSSFLLILSCHQIEFIGCSPTLVQRGEARRAPEPLFREHLFPAGAYCWGPVWPQWRRERKPGRGISRSNATAQRTAWGRPPRCFPPARTGAEAGTEHCGAE